MITDHMTNAANSDITIEPSNLGPGGAYHTYRAYHGDKLLGTVDFQFGPIKESGLNGLTHEVLIAIILNRLRAFQDGAYKCRENALAITKLEEALHWLHHRTRQRELRGVEGTHTV